MTQELAHKTQDSGSFPETVESKNVYENITPASIKERLQYLRIQGLCTGPQECCEKDVQIWQYLLENDAEAAQLDHYAGYKLAEYLTPRRKSVT